MNEALQVFLNTVATAGGVIAAMVLGVMAIATFFKVASWFAGDDSESTSFVAGESELAEASVATVHLIGGRTFENVRVSGLNAGYGYDANQMLVLEDDDGTRFFVQHRHVRLIVVPSNVESVEPGDDE